MPFVTIKDKDNATLGHLQTDANERLGVHNLLHVQDLKENTANSGTFTSGAYRTRDITHVAVNNIQDASLSSNRITLPAGKYFLDAKMSAYKVGGHYGRLYSITDSEEFLLSLQGYGAAAEGQNQFCLLSGVFEIAKTHLFEIQHFCTTTAITQGFGTWSGGASFNMFLDAKIWKIA